MKVYIVTAGFNWEGYENQYVASTEEKAREIVEKIKSSNIYDNVGFQVHVVDSSYLE